MSLRLSDDDRVCIVGGGPAGSFAALHLLNRIGQLGLQLEVKIFEPRDFNRPGPGGCNRCAGILSSYLLEGLDRLDIPLPTEVIQSEVHAYTVHLEKETVRINRPDPDRRIVSIYRGGGPRLHQGDPAVSFDGFLLSQACARGAEHIPARVIAVTWEGQPVIHTASERYATDLVILATGVNNRSPLHKDFKYRPPKTAVMAQDEFLRPSEWPSDLVSAYFQKPRGLLFGALIPKWQYINISLLGRNLATDAISEFIETQGLSNSLPPLDGSLCGCSPRIAVRSAKRYFGDRWVAVGDAAVTRLYKDGIGSAYSTAERAVHASLHVGISRATFQKFYAPFCRKIERDNNYGRLLFHLWSLTQRVPFLLQAWARVIQEEESLPQNRRLHTMILWGMFTGDELYRNLFQRLVTIEALKLLFQNARRVQRKRGIDGNEKTG